MANFNFKFPFVMMAFLVQLMLSKIMTFVKKLHQLLINNKRVDKLTWIALLCVDPLLYYVPTVDSQNIALHVNYPLLITLWVLYLSLVGYRIYRCMISRKNRLIIISAETTLLVINHAVSLWLLIFRPAMEISSPLSVIIVFVVVGAYLLRVYAVFEWFARQIQGIFALWLLAAIIYIYGGYIFGSFWFYLAINKQIICWKNACTTLDGCHFSPPNFIFNLKEREILINSCSVNSKLGFLKDTFVSGIIYREGLWQRVFMCLRWGIQTICTFASAPRMYNSYNWNDELESAFVISVVIYAAVTICLFISNLGSTRKIKN